MDRMNRDQLFMLFLKNWVAWSETSVHEVQNKENDSSYRYR